ncbi:hypothetical protein chiPu_0010564 [Chiloscyllium punctatum]|uniref:Uncharacterized protein n=1 Tax=Chiloscyllium punctatum TaxID=137246 RepID=A0A401SNY1_CHIPU|nr:hypothetical protein [Chiloscyllium punctatum]
MRREAGFEVRGDVIPLEGWGKRCAVTGDRGGRRGQGQGLAVTSGPVGRRGRNCAMMSDRVGTQARGATR